VIIISFSSPFPSFLVPRFDFASSQLGYFDFASIVWRSPCSTMRRRGTALLLFHSFVSSILSCSDLFNRLSSNRFLTPQLQTNDILSRPSAHSIRIHWIGPRLVTRHPHSPHNNADATSGNPTQPVHYSACALRLTLYVAYSEGDYHLLLLLLPLSHRFFGDEI
jgi:hypothetical protein